MEKHEPKTTLVVTAGELHDLIDALGAMEARCALEGRQRAATGDALGAHKKNAVAERYMRLLRRLQETEAILAARKSGYPEGVYT